MDRFELAVTPEGTRSLVTTWKRGFYFIALKAKLPIMLYAIDYDNKTVICNKTIMPSGDVDADMRLIMDYYRRTKENILANSQWRIFRLPTRNKCRPKRREHTEVYLRSYGLSGKKHMGRQNVFQDVPQTITMTFPFVQTTCDERLSTKQ